MTLEMQNDAASLALVICTRNRSRSLKNLLELIAIQKTIPDCVLVVDSSDDDSTELLVKGYKKLPLLIFVKSKPGLPHQRNVGVRFLKKENVYESLMYVSFLDDDIEINPNYFENVTKCFSDFPKAVIVGGYDKEAKYRAGNRITQLLNITGSSPGKILKSGIASYPFPNSQVTQVSWVPGGMSNYRKWLFDTHEFRGQVRMYGEDIEMQLRVREHGQLIVSQNLAVSHLSSTVGKDDKRGQASYGDGFRWWLAKTYPKEFSSFWVVSTTVLISLQCLTASLARLDKSKLDEFLGHIDFLSRLIFGNTTEQFVSHSDWI